MIERIGWALLGLLHVLPALALFRPSWIERLYGAQAGSNSFLLLHHRAALFLAIVAICIWAIFRPEVRPLASVAVAISMISFIVIWWMAGTPPSLKTIAVADMVGLPILAYVAWQASHLTGAK